MFLFDDIHHAFNLTDIVGADQGWVAPYCYHIDKDILLGDYSHAPHLHLEAFDGTIYKCGLVRGSGNGFDNLRDHEASVKEEWS